MPADKNLGCVLTTRSEYGILVKDQLDKAFTQIQEPEAVHIFEKTVAAIDDALAFGEENKALPSKVSDYIRCLATVGKARIPRIRALLKMHKPVVSARLIVASTALVTTPAAIYVASILQIIVASFLEVASATSDVIDLVQKYQPGGDDFMHTFDVDNMYPSLDQSVLVHSVRTVLIAYYSNKPEPAWGARVEFIILLVQLILSAQVCKWSARSGQSISYWRQHIGVSTGLACGSQFANCYLRALDLSITSSFRSIRVYTRYIDDILIISSIDILQALLVAFNSFDEYISISHDPEEDCKRVSFLDLDLQLLPASICFRTFRKPLATFNYLPFQSCHSMLTKQAIVHTELIRVLRTCSTEQAFEEEARLTLSKFRDRGYDIMLIRSVAAKVTWSATEFHVKSNLAKPKIVPFKFRFSQYAEKLGLSNLIREAATNLPSDFVKSHKIVVCYLTGRSLFRQRYTRFF